MAKYTFLNFAEDVLKQAKTPLSYTEVWHEGVKLGLDKKLESDGKTPMNTLSAILGKNTYGDDSLFCVASESPRTFWLREREIELIGDKIKENIEKKNKIESRETKREYTERDLHPLLVKFMRDNGSFHLYCKTIFHELSNRQEGGKNQWIHPDIVGVHYPFGFKKETIGFLKTFSKNPYKLYSFELKVELNFSNLRSCYFQAVSNSSWANEGYLVFLHWKEENELMEELERLNQAFGIGLIKLNVDDLVSSQILLPAKKREELDFKTINKLVGENPNFKNFIEDINRYIGVGDFKHIVEKDYDEVYDDEKMEKYIKDKKII